MPSLFLQPGVNLHGHVRADYGMGQGVRSTARALQAAQVPLSLHNLASGLQHENDTTLTALERDYTAHNVNIFHINADQTLHFDQRINPHVLGGRYNIGCWVWELPRFPDEWLHAFDFVDEVWTPSLYSQQAIQAKTSKPVIVMPHPTEPVFNTFLSRAELDLPLNKFLFLFTFDLNSYIERKNPFACITAFHKAFGKVGEKNFRDDAFLVVKLHGAGQTQDRAQLARMIEGDARIQVIDRVFTRHEIESLMMACDAFVTLHRAEGFGHAIAEAMVLGKPVIATAHSGNVDFMSEADACLVRARIIPVLEGQYPHWQNQTWADADTDHAAQFMQRLIDEPGYCAQIGAAARARCERELSLAVVGEKMRVRLDAIGMAGFKPALRRMRYLGARAAKQVLPLLARMPRPF